MNSTHKGCSDLRASGGQGQAHGSQPAAASGGRGRRLPRPSYARSRLPRGSVPRCRAGRSAGGPPGWQPECRMSAFTICATPRHRYGWPQAPTRRSCSGYWARHRRDDDGPLRAPGGCQLVASRPADRDTTGASEPPQERIRTESERGGMRKTLKSWAFTREPPWEPPWGIEPQTYALREARDNVPGALPAPIAARLPRNALSAQRARIPGPRPGPRTGVRSDNRVLLENEMPLTQGCWPAVRLMQ